MTDHSSRLVWDRDRSACLCGVGNPLGLAAVFVNGHGADEYWLIEDDNRSPDRHTFDAPQSRATAPPHEHLGRLPVEWRDRIWGNALRCGRRYVDGTACGHRVAEPGGACAVHVGRQS